MNRHSKRRRSLLALVLVLCSALAVSAAGTWLALNWRDQGRPAGPVPGTAAPAPARTQAQADMSQMQALLNSGSAAQQAALLPPGAAFTPGSGPVFPAGTTITIRQGTFHADGQLATVQGRLSTGKAVTLGLIAGQGHWHLFDVTAGTAQTSASTSAVYGPRVQLMSSTDGGPIPTRAQLGTRTPVIFIHGVWPGKPADFGDDNHPGSMFASVDSILGTWTASFGYVGTNSQWVDVNGPLFARYVHEIAKLSRDNHGPGKVIIVAYSMGGLITREAASRTLYGQPVKDDIAMVITIGTPNTGAAAAGVADPIHEAICIVLREHGYGGIPFCAADFTALAGMSKWNTEIGKLPELPVTDTHGIVIPLVAIGGDETVTLPLAFATYQWNLNGDLIVATGSALYRRTGDHETRTTIQNPTALFNLSAWHGALPQNKDIIAIVHDRVAAWIRGHPAPVQAQAPAPAPAGEVNPNWADYWNGGGAGQWYVHGMTLRFDQGQGIGAGTFRWNAYGTVVLGEQHASFVLQSDGSLVGTFTDDPVYHEASGQAASNGFTPPPGGPRQGQTFTLVPDGPGHARYAGGASPWGGNPNLCQQGAPPDVIQACGA